MSTRGKMQLTDEQALQVIENVEKRYEKLREKIKRRRAHFFHDASEFPDLGKQWEEAIRYQTDIPRRLHAKLKARLTENHFVFRVKPIKDIPSQRQKANDLEEVFNTGLSFVEERERLDIQGFLSDGQIIDGLSWLHWRRADHIWPEVPEYSETDELPMCEMCEGTRKAAGKTCPECRGTGTADGIDYEAKEEGGGYKETDDSLQKRRLHDTASAGFPWYVEVPPAVAVSAMEDKSLEQGAAIVVLRRVVPVLDYLETVKKERGDAEQAMSLHDANPMIPVYGEVDGPDNDSVSAGDYTKRVSVVELWTRDEFYEFCDYGGVTEAGTSGGLQFIKGFKHSYGMPPFALCPAMEVNDPDPHNRFMPVLEGVFRLKATYDRLVSLMMVISEQTALPYYYWANTATGEPALMEDGDKTTFTFQRNSALAEVAMSGHELRKVEFDLNPAFSNVIELMREEVEAAFPSVGTAEISASTQPWTVRLQQAQESVEPKALVIRQAKTITVMGRNMAEVMSKPAEDGGLGEPITTFKRVRKGVVNPDEVIAVDPKDIISLNIGVDIDAESSAERITRTEHGMGLLKEGLITMPEFFEQYMGEEDGDEKHAGLLAYQMFMEQMLPLWSKQFVAEWGGKKFALGPNGDIFGMGGQEVTPAEVLAANGISVPQPPMPMGAPAPGGGGPGPVGPPQMGPAMPQLPGLAGPPSAMPLGGMR